MSDSKIKSAVDQAIAEASVRLRNVFCSAGPEAYEALINGDMQFFGRQRQCGSRTLAELRSARVRARASLGLAMDEDDLRASAKAWVTHSASNPGNEVARNLFKRVSAGLLHAISSAQDKRASRECLLDGLGAATEMFAALQTNPTSRTEIPEQRITATAALLLRERAIQMEELAFTFSLARQGGADANRITRHHADIEHLVVAALKAGIELAGGAR